MDQGEVSAPYDAPGVQPAAHREKAAGDLIKYLTLWPDGRPPRGVLADHHPEKTTTPMSAADPLRINFETRTDRSRRFVEKPLAATPGLVDARVAAAMCGVGRTHWLEMRAAGRVPEPVHLGRRVLWNVDELRAWTEAGVPPLRQWKRIKEQQASDRKRK